MVVQAGSALAGGVGGTYWLPQRLVPPDHLAQSVYSEQAGIERHQDETHPRIAGVVYDKLVDAHDADCDERDRNPLATAESVERLEIASRRWPVLIPKQYA